MPAFDPMEYDSHPTDSALTEGAKLSQNDIAPTNSATVAESNFPYGLAGVGSLGLGVFLHSVTPPEWSIVAMIGLMMIILAPVICFSGLKKTKSQWWIMTTITFTLLPSIFTLFAWPLLMRGHGTQ